METTQTRADAVFLLIAGSVFFPGALISFKMLLQNYVVCSQSDAIIAATRLVSSLQSALASVAGFIIAFSCTHQIHDRHWLAESYVLFAAPYFLYDIGAMFLCYRERIRVQGAVPGSRCKAAIGFLKKEALLILHHLFMLLFCFPASVFWREGKGDYFQGLLLLPEFSTPFLCAGKILLQFRLQSSVLYKVNGLLTLSSFLLFRVVLFPYLYFTYSRFSGLSLWSVVSSAPWQCNVGAAVLWPLQLYWFCLLCRAAVRSVSTERRHKHQD